MYTTPSTLPVLEEFPAMDKDEQVITVAVVVRMVVHLAAVNMAPSEEAEVAMVVTEAVALKAEEECLRDWL
jgi:hypothetical protein